MKFLDQLKLLSGLFPEKTVEEIVVIIEKYKKLGLLKSKIKILDEKRRCVEDEQQEELMKFLSELLHKVDFSDLPSLVGYIKYTSCDGHEVTVFTKHTPNGRFTSNGKKFDMWIEVVNDYGKNPEFIAPDGWVKFPDDLVLEKYVETNRYTGEPSTHYRFVSPVSEKVNAFEFLFGADAVGGGADADAAGGGADAAAQ